MAIMNLTYKSNKTAVGKLANGLIKEQASEALPEALPAGPPIGANPGSMLVVEGTNEDDLGVPVPPAPSDWGAGEGAKVVSRIAEVGGAISGGNFCAPALHFKVHFLSYKLITTKFLAP